MDVWPPRKILTKKRLVHGISSVLVKNNYDDFQGENGERKWETLTGYPGSEKDKITKTITWTSGFPLQGRQQICDEISYGDNSLTPLGQARDIVTIED